MVRNRIFTFHYPAHLIILIDVDLAILLYYSHNLNQALEKLDLPQSRFQSRRISRTPFRKKMRLQWIWCGRKIWVFNFFKMRILFISKQIWGRIFEYGTFDIVHLTNLLDEYIHNKKKSSPCRYVASRGQREKEEDIYEVFPPTITVRHRSTRIIRHR